MTEAENGTSADDRQDEFNVPELQPFTSKEWLKWRKDVEQALNTHEELLEKLIEILEEAEAGGRYHWDYLKAHKKAKLMGRLVVFVNWLDRTYLQQVTTFELKPCWWRHPDIVWQLTALMLAHAAVYNATAKPSMDFVTFHTHALWPTLERITSNGTMRKCEKGKHDPSKISPLIVDEALEAQIRTWEGDASEKNSLDLGGGDSGGRGSDHGDGSRPEVNVEHTNTEIIDRITRDGGNADRDTDSRS